ncbi:hypothetical protein G9A89_019657 [Geosiphon pyriformis]|nr:hypothetical protein G9A89_019657 [Geosiphon pyriformis]
MLEDVFLIMKLSGRVQGLEYVPVPGQLRDTYVIAITQLDGFVLLGCQTSSRVMNERTSTWVERGEQL